MTHELNVDRKKKTYNLNTHLDMYVLSIKYCVKTKITNIKFIK